MNSCDRATLSRTVRCSFIRRADSPAPYLLMMSKQELLFLLFFLLPAGHNSAVDNICEEIHTTASAFIYR
ncbi:hypothetical protein CEXT_510661 [Caerostris extrusa]|uniref:Uncharacterized protein n=1 Tax=Caerostris extrusa TaxID=172846 RepID=A0AAV4XRE9_CAEEX|nr:hypothetical protein CEXT_510661 [Caerostris extrusa]